ncbi:MAG: hypothetical protein EA344_13305 [Alkalicoccus sp.]|uniref:Uncharacterized protein n=1 Tax=Alkalicoccus sp. TaxID=2005376 RepID=A0A651DHY7_9BACI|nr:MAG: hypothetical protein EA344_13305 [Alkalicoccus sp.]
MNTYVPQQIKKEGRKTMIKTKTGFLIPVFVLAACQGDAPEQEWEESAEAEEIEEVRQPAEEDWESGEFMEKTFDYEAAFAQNDYAGEVDGDELYEFEAGEEDTTILITAPHTTAYLRDSDQETQPAAIYTGALIQLLQDYTGAHILYTVKKDADPSFYPASPFKQEMERIVEDHEVDVVIDLLGAGASHNFAIDIGTDDGAYMDDTYSADLNAFAEQQGVGPVVLNNTFSASDDQTIAAFSHRELDLASMQLQIQSGYRNPRENEEAFYDMTVVLSEFIHHLDRSYEK